MFTPSHRSDLGKDLKPHWNDRIFEVWTVVWKQNAICLSWEKLQILRWQILDTPPITIRDLKLMEENFTPHERPTFFWIGPFGSQRDLPRNWKWTMVFSFTENPERRKRKIIFLDKGRLCQTQGLPVGRNFNIEQQDRPELFSSTWNTLKESLS